MVKISDSDNGFNYYNLLKRYSQNPNNGVVNSKLQYLKSIGVPEDDEDTFFFLSQLMTLAKNNGDRKTVTQIREISNRMKNTSGSSMMRTVMLEESLKSETDCIELMEECFKNGVYESALDNITDFIRKNKEISTVVRILQVIKSRTEEMGITDNSRVAMQFREKIDRVLKKDAGVCREEGLLGKYFAKNWNKLTDKEVKKYLEIRSLYTKNKFEVKREESPSTKHKKFIKNCALTHSVPIANGEFNFEIDNVSVIENDEGTLNYTLNCKLEQCAFHEESTVFTIQCQGYTDKVILKYQECCKLKIQFAAPQLTKLPISFTYKYYENKYHYKCAYKLEEHTLYETDFNF